MDAKKFVPLMAEGHSATLKHTLRSNNLDCGAKDSPRGEYPVESVGVDWVM